MLTMIEALKQHASFFRMETNKLSVVSEDEKVVVVTHKEIPYNLLKEEAERLKNSLPTIDFAYIVPVEYDVDFGYKKTKGYVAWIKTQHFIIQNHYFLESGTITLDSSVLGYDEEELFELPVLIQEEIKQIMLTFKMLIEEKHGQEVVFEEPLQEFLDTNSVQYLKIGAANTSIKIHGIAVSIERWMEMVDGSIEDAEEDGLNVYQMVSQMEEDYYEPWRNPFFSYVGLTKIIHEIKKQATNDEYVAFVQELERRQQKSYVMLSGEQKELTKKLFI